MRRAVFLILVLVLLLAPLFYRAYTESRVSYLLGKKYEQQQDIVAAARAYNDSASWRALFVVPARASLERLRALVQDSALSPGERHEVQVQLYQTLMRSRTLFDNKEEQERLALEQQLLTYASDNKGSSLVRRKHDFAVQEEVQLFVQLAFWCWVLSVAVMIRYGFTSDGRLVPRPFVSSGGVAIVCFSLWLYFLTLA